MSNTINPFAKCPDEVFYKIFNGLDLESHLTLRRVDRCLRNISDDIRLKYVKKFTLIIELWENYRTTKVRIDPSRIIFLQRDLQIQQNYPIKLFNRIFFEPEARISEMPITITQDKSSHVKGFIDDINLFKLKLRLLIYKSKAFEIDVVENSRLLIMTIFDGRKNFEELPILDIVSTHALDNLKPEQMYASVMRGKLSQGQLFFAIKMSRHLGSNTIVYFSECPINKGNWYSKSDKLRVIISYPKEYVKTPEGMVTKYHEPEIFEDSLYQFYTFIKLGKLAHYTIY